MDAWADAVGFKPFWDSGVCFRSRNLVDVLLRAQVLKFQRPLPEMQNPSWPAAPRSTSVTFCFFTLWPCKC